MRRTRDDDTGGPGPGTVIAGIGCVLLELTLLAYAVGAVVAPVGDALGAVRGVGGLFGYLFVACLAALPTVLLLAMLVAGNVPPPDQEPASRPAAAAIRPLLALPDGPGLAVRWTAALPLMLLAAFGPLAWAVVLGAWSAMSYGELLAAVDPARPVPELGTQLWTSLAQLWPMAFVPAVVLAGFLLRRNRMAPWPAACLVTSGLTVGLSTATAFSPDDEMVASVPNVVLSAAVVGAAHLLGRLAVAALTRPVAADVVSSGLELAYRLPGGRRLRIQDGGLVLDRLTRWRKSPDLARTSIPWQALGDARVENAPTDRRCRPAPGAAAFEVPAGPAVRVVADGQQWLLPARNEQVARTIVTAIALRAHRYESCDQM